MIRRNPFTVSQYAVEYIFDPESLLIFQLISQNILATWNTDITRYFGLNDEYHIGNSLFIRPHNSYH